jgi:hypothetical protein
MQPSVTYTSTERHTMRSCTEGGVLDTTTMGLMLHPSFPRRWYSRMDRSSHRSASKSPSTAEEGSVEERV